MNGPPVDPARGTGRTTRMLESALELCRITPRTTVVVLGDNTGHIDHMFRMMLREVMPRQMVLPTEFEVFRTNHEIRFPPNGGKVLFRRYHTEDWDWETKRIGPRYYGYQNIHFLMDHYTEEVVRAEVERRRVIEQMARDAWMVDHPEAHAPGWEDAPYYKRQEYLRLAAERYRKREIRRLRPVP